MKNIPLNFYDVGLHDPPYGIGESSKNHKGRNGPVTQKNGNKLRIKDPVYARKDWDNNVPSDEFFQLINYTCRHNIIYGANYFKQIVGTPFKPPRRHNYDEFLSCYPEGWIIWDKVNGDNDFNDCELIYTDYNFPSFVLHYMWNGMMHGKSIEEGTIQQGNKKLNEKRIHPTQKPVKVTKYLLTQIVGEVFNKVLVTHGGSCGEAIAAHDMGIDMDICETDQEYFLLGQERYNNHKRQLKLF